QSGAAIEAGRSGGARWKGLDCSARVFASGATGDSGRVARGCVEIAWTGARAGTAGTQRGAALCGSDAAHWRSERSGSPAGTFCQDGKRRGVYGDIQRRAEKSWKAGSGARCFGKTGSGEECRDGPTVRIGGCICDSGTGREVAGVVARAEAEDVRGKTAKRICSGTGQPWSEASEVASDTGILGSALQR